MAYYLNAYHCFPGYRGLLIKAHHNGFLPTFKAIRRLIARDIIADYEARITNLEDIIKKQQEIMRDE